MWGRVNEQSRRAVKGLPCVGWYGGVVGLLMGGGVRAALVRPSDEGESELIGKPKNSIAIIFGLGPSPAVRSTRAGQGERNEQELRVSPGNYGLPCSINISTIFKNGRKRLCRGTPPPRPFCLLEK